jgi:hypothetical protein
LVPVEYRVCYCVLHGSAIMAWFAMSFWRLDCA